MYFRYLLLGWLLLPMLPSHKGTHTQYSGVEFLTSSEENLTVAEYHADCVGLKVFM